MKRPLSKVRCPGSGCSWSGGKSLVFGFIDEIECPNCNNEGVISKTDNGGSKAFRCNRCSTLWQRVPCPRCGTGIDASACYVATCVYGSYDCPEVWTLRRFRDDVLAQKWLGRRFISVYYTVAPRVTEIFGNQKWFHKIWKPRIDALVKKLQNKGIDNSPYSDGN
jgi:hypothetical protein